MADPFGENLGYLLNRCGGQMAARFARALEPYGISIAQWGALLAIHERGQAAPSEIAARIGIDRGATTRLVARMEAKEFVERRENAEDGRSVMLSLSPGTAALMPELLALSRKVNQEALALLPDPEAAALLSTLRQLSDGLRG